MIRPNTTYLLGAGASAQALPINKCLLDSIVLQKDWLSDILDNSDTLRQYKEDVDWLEQEYINRSSATIDSLACQLYEERHLYTITKDSQPPFDRLKAIITTYFVIEQHKKKPDSRYSELIGQLCKDAEANSISLGEYLDINSIKILSWNYDFQIELAYLKLCKMSIKFEDVNGLLGIVNKNDRKSLDDKIHKNIFKLNGTCAYTDQGFAQINEFEENYDLNNKKYNDILIKHNNRIKSLTNAMESSLLSYSFENERTPINISDYAISAIEKTKNLVVIGYSFPIDSENVNVNRNRDIDSFLLSKMSDLEVIIVRDKYPENVKRVIESMLTKRTTINISVTTFDSFI